MGLFSKIKQLVHIKGMRLCAMRSRARAGGTPLFWKLQSMHKRNTVQRALVPVLSRAARSFYTTGMLNLQTLWRHISSRFNTLRKQFVSLSQPGTADLLRLATV